MDLMQAWAVPVLAVLVSVSSYDLCSVDFEGPVLLVPSIPSASCTISASSSVGFPELWGKGFEGIIPSRAVCYKVSLLSLSPSLPSSSSLSPSLSCSVDLSSLSTAVLIYSWVRILTSSVCLVFGAPVSIFWVFCFSTTVWCLFTVLNEAGTSFPWQCELDLCLQIRTTEGSQAGC